MRWDLFGRNRLEISTLESYNNRHKLKEPFNAATANRTLTCYRCFIHLPLL